MKRLSYTIMFTLSLLILGSPVQASEVKATHLHNSAALPRNARMPSATYRIRVHVGNTPLTHLSIHDLPKQLRIKQSITVVNQEGQILSAIPTASQNTITIAFDQPVLPGTRLEVSLNGVRTQDYLGRTWLLSVSSRSAGMSDYIPLGIARIQTSK